MIRGLYENGKIICLGRHRDLGFANVSQVLVLDFARVN